MRFRIVEVRPSVYIVERRVFFFWVSLKKWCVASTFGAYIDEEHLSLPSANKAIAKFCEKRPKPYYPKVVQIVTKEC